MILQRSSSPKDENPSDTRQPGSTVVHSLYKKASLECEHAAFILINIFIERKLSPGSVCLIILIYSLILQLDFSLYSLLRSLNGFCKRKGNGTGFEWRPQGKKGERVDSCCLLASMLEQLPQDPVMLTSSLCPAYTCKSPLRETGEGIHLDHLYDRELCFTARSSVECSVHGNKRPAPP